jgi:hypothetical protein
MKYLNTIYRCACSALFHPRFVSICNEAQEHVIGANQVSVDLPPNTSVGVGEKPNAIPLDNLIG